MSNIHPKYFPYFPDGYGPLTRRAIYAARKYNGDDTINPKTGHATKDDYALSVIKSSSWWRRRGADNLAQIRGDCPKKNTK